jgi:hypothetical protein
MRTAPRGKERKGKKMVKVVNGVKYVEVYKNNAGKNWEISLDHHIGGNRTKGDNVSCADGADLTWNGLEISVKSARFTLMSGSLSKDCNGFDEIFQRYTEIDKSNCVVYMTKAGDGYMMTHEEFKEFVYRFCGLERESERNGRYWKIKARSESKALLEWLGEHTA